MLSNYIQMRNDESEEFFNIANHHFNRADEIDSVLLEAFAKRWNANVDKRIPLEVLREMGDRRGWDDADIGLMSRQSVDDFEHMFETLRGDDVRRSIEILLTLCRSHVDGSDKIFDAATEALRRIAAKSPLRARKVQRFGITLEVPAEVP